jgi:thiamine pyrophosphate-dependent acetolactate synthase large subunit-like protein
VDFPQNVLEDIVTDEEAVLPDRYRSQARPHGDPVLVKEAVSMLVGAQRPLVVYGSGIIWSNAHEELQNFLELTGIPSVPTPLARAAISRSNCGPTNSRSSISPLRRRSVHPQQHGTAR